MSLQRAKINCERCYNLARIYLNKFEKANSGAAETETYKEVFEKIVRDENLWVARNETLKSLEDIKEKVIDGALDNCMICDFSKPSIKVIYEDGLV